MMLPRHRESRLGRALGKKAASAPTAAEMINAAAARKPLPDAPAAKPVVPPAPRVPQATAEPAERALPKPPPPPPPPPQWWEEMCSWRPRGQADPHVDENVRYETIHEYDPIEWALHEDADLDD